MNRSSQTPHRTRKRSTASNAVFPSTPQAAEEFVQRIVRVLTAHGFANEELDEIRSAVHAAVDNAIRHGNQLDSAKHVHVFFSVTPSQFSIRIQDEGPGFDPSRLPVPSTTSKQRHSRHGWEFICNVMDEVRFNPKGNAVTMVRRR